ncbi:MAG TPA: RNA-binding cell elongation regulator Jag/EloR [bacterium]|nr:RNA-binding cell elongation regulator Jag/EloR [bacterium]
MRNFSNQGSGGGRPPGNSGGRPPGSNRGGYGGNRSGGYNRENRDNRGDREGRSGGYRGGQNRYENREGRGEHRSGGHRSGGHSPYRGDRHDRHEREDRPRHERSEGFTPRTGGSWVEVTGRTAEEAIEEASRRFNVGRSDLKTEVLDEGSKGFLGIGSKPAKVKISLKPTAVPAFAEGILSRLLRGMSMPDKVKIQKDPDGNTVLNIQGPSSGTLIGRHGHTLESLQYLVSKVVQRMTGDEKSIVIVDVESYLERQIEKLKELAVNLAQKAKETGVEIPMRPMSSKDRRVVHMVLKDHEHVTTESRGEGLRRKVVIVPKVKAAETTPEAAAQAAASAAEAGNVAPASVAPPEDKETPGNVAPPAMVETPTDGPEPGNMVPKEPEVDDNVGNRA